MKNAALRRSGTADCFFDRFLGGKLDVDRESFGAPAVAADIDLFGPAGDGGIGGGNRNRDGGREFSGSRRLHDDIKLKIALGIDLDLEFVAWRPCAIRRQKDGCRGG